MVQTLKSEAKKLLTVRSTYLLALLVIVLSGLFTYLGTSGQYTGGNCPEPKTKEVKTAGGQTKVETTFQDCPPPKLSKDLPKDALKSNLFNTVMGASLLIAVAVLLLMAHEYRYNTITYTLTLSNSRSKVLAAKLVIGTAYALILIIVALAVSVAATYAAVAVKDLNLPPQDIKWLYLLGRSLLYTIGFALLGLAIITLVRNLVIGIVSLFILPGIDSILSNVFVKHNLEPASYLPFSALNRVVTEITSGDVVGPGAPEPSYAQASVARASLVFIIYLAGVWIISWYLFLRRDAS